MLRASRILREHLCQRPLVRYFSSAPSALLFPQISKEAQKALWAQKMIQTIAFPDEDSNLGDSLRDKVMNCAVPNKQFHFDQETKQEVLKMFKDGIELHPSVFTQGRIRDASTKANKAVFCPNRLITSKMFEILQSPKKHSLIIDSCQAGKTFSILAYIHLTRFIHQYIYDAAYSENAKLKDQYKMLRRNSHLFPGTKLWYWSINQSEICRPNFSLKKIILAQATEISSQIKAELQKCDQVDQLIKKVTEHYEKTEINIVPVIDQSNQLTSLMRQWNQCNNKNKDNQKASQENSQVLKIFQNVQKFRSIASVISSLILSFSTNIEQDLIYKDQNLHEPGPLNFGLKKSKGQLASKQYLNYHKDIHTQWGKRDFWDFFWFELSKYLKQSNKIQDRKNDFLKEVQKYEVQNYYTFLEIRLFLSNDRERIRKFNEILKDKIDQKELEKLILEFDEQCLKTCVDRIKESMLSLGKNNNLMMDFLRATYILALKNISDDCKNFVIANQQIESSLKNNSFTLLPFLQQINKHKNVIPVNINENKSVEFLWGPKTFSKVIQQVMIQERKSQKPYNRIEDKKVYFGRKAEGLIIDQLDKDAVVKLYNFDLPRPVFKKIDDSMPLKRYGVEAEHKIEIKNIVNFTPFPVKQEQYPKFYIDDSLSKLFSSCRSFRHVWSAAVPQNYKEKKNYASNIPTVDFVLAKRQDIHSSDRFLIYCVDIALTRKAVEGRQQKALKMYEEFYKRYSYERSYYRLTHLILCPKALCLDSFRQTKTFYTVKYSAIEMLKIEETKWKDQKFMFEALQQYMSLNHEI